MRPRQTHKCLYNEVLVIKIVLFWCWKSGYCVQSQLAHNDITVTSQQRDVVQLFSQLECVKSVEYKIVHFVNGVLTWDSSADGHAVASPLAFRTTELQSGLVCPPQVMWSVSVCVCVCQLSSQLHWRISANSWRVNRPPTCRHISAWN